MDSNTVWLAGLHISEGSHTMLKRLVAGSGKTQPKVVTELLEEAIEEAYNKVI